MPRWTFELKSSCEFPEMCYTKHKVYDRCVAVAWYVYKGTVSSKSIISATRLKVICIGIMRFICVIRWLPRTLPGALADYKLIPQQRVSQSVTAGCLKHVVYCNVFHNDWWIGVLTLSGSPANVLSQLYLLLYYAVVIRICINAVLLSGLRFEELV
jgi:hypothetical protein